MRIAVAKEIKKHEYRVGMTPSCVKTYVQHGHSVTVESGAGDGTGYSDREYKAAGATIRIGRAPGSALRPRRSQVRRPATCVASGSCIRISHWLNGEYAQTCDIASSAAVNPALRFPARLYNPSSSISTRPWPCSSSHQYVKCFDSQLAARSSARSRTRDV